MTRAMNAALSTVSAATDSGILLPENTGRLGAIMDNDSTATLFIAYDDEAAEIRRTYKIPPGAIWEMPGNLLYGGKISGVWSAVNGRVHITELLP